MSPPLQKLYERFGPKTVFIPVIPPDGKEQDGKHPKHKGWPNTTFEQTQTDEYQAELLKGNIGAVWGPASGDLVDLDCDEQSAVDQFLRDNPWATGTLQIESGRGRHFIFRLKGDYPQKVIRILHVTETVTRVLKNGSTVALPKQLGEWRGGNGSHSVIAGLHKSGCNYRILGAEVMVIAVDQFTRPAEWKAVWDVPPTPEWKPDWDTSGDGSRPKKFSSADPLLHKRLVAYMGRVEPSIAGEHGDDQLFRAARILVCGWGLSQAEALPYMQAFNERCEPPWREYRLRYKLDEADKHGRGVRGRLRETGQEWAERRKREARERDYRQKVESGEIPPQEDHPRDEGDDWQESERATAFSNSITKGSKLVDIEVPPKKMIIDDWFKEGDLGFLFAYRGAGKTWLTLDLCVALADGGKCGPWQVNDKWPVLYIDGEMSHDDDKNRITGLCNPIPENLYVLNHEVLFHYHKLVMNFGNPIDQAIIKKVCLDTGIKVLVLDNLGCLVSGVEENKADEWEKMLPWLLDLRRLGISIIIVHHSGHDSTRMRGTVKREDSAAWVLRLDDQRQDYSEAGAHFISRFRKLRGNKPALDYEWRYEPAGDSGVLVTFKEANRADVVVQWVKDGLTSATAIAKEMGITEGAVSKLATRLIKEGKLIKNRRDYAIP